VSVGETDGDDMVEVGKRWTTADEHKCAFEGEGQVRMIHQCSTVLSHCPAHFLNFIPSVLYFLSSSRAAVLENANTSARGYPCPATRSLQMCA
jgi:hypothetical protein